jgi:hypothetical protein
MTTLNECALQAAAEAIAESDIGYEIKLTKFVDGVSEYSVTFPDGSEPRTFPGYSAASEYVERERNLSKAKAAVEAYLAGMGEELQPTAWCQPDYDGKTHPRKFMVVYEDAEMGNAIFDDEAEAREHFEKASISWNCYLFGLLPRADENTWKPVPRGGIEPNWWEEWQKIVRKYRKLEKAARFVISETDRINDHDPWPIKYRAPYHAITKLRELIPDPPSIRSDDREGGR